MTNYNRANFVFAAPLILVVLCIYIFNSDMDSISTHPANIGTINAVIGDKSYIERYGINPRPGISDNIRINIHLQYVEEKLRNRSVDHLTSEQQTNRIHHLNLLREYRKRGEFHHNDGHPAERRPTFIDKDGNICAVGYLVEQTLGRETAETLNQHYKYAYIEDIYHPKFENWVAQSGLTKQELAMIQPAYGDGGGRVIDDSKVNKNDIGAVYGTASLLLNSANGLYLSNRNNDPWLFNNNQRFHWYGMAMGVSSVVLGSLNLDNGRLSANSGRFCFGPGPCPDFRREQSNHARTALSAFNIASGAATMVRAGYHLIFNSNSKQVHSNSGTHVDIATTNIPSTNNSYEMVPTLNVRVSF